jgi:hypothetical protein
MGLPLTLLEFVRRAEAVNAAKLKFRALCTPLQGIRIRIPVKDEPLPTKKIPAIRVILRNIQRSDLNLLAACGGGGGGGGAPVMTTYLIGGAVSGLASGESVTLANGSDCAFPHPGGEPVFLAFDPTGKYAYEANYTVDVSTGALNDWSLSNISIR